MITCKQCNMEVKSIVERDNELCVDCYFEKQNDEVVN